MAQFERQTAKKMRILDLNQGTWIQQDPGGYLEGPGGEKIARARVMATIMTKFVSEDGAFGSVTLDDGTDTMRAKCFKELDVMEPVQIGDIVDLIGKVRMYNEEIYLIPEIIRKLDNPNWEILRKLELVEKFGKEPPAPAPGPDQKAETAKHANDVLAKELEQTGQQTIQPAEAGRETVPKPTQAPEADGGAKAPPQTESAPAQDSLQQAQYPAGEIKPADITGEAGAETKPATTVEDAKQAGTEIKPEVEKPAEAGEESKQEPTKTKPEVKQAETQAKTKPEDKPDTEEARDKILTLIEESDDSIGYMELVDQSGLDKETVEAVVNELLSGGICYEPTPGKIKKI